MKVRHVLQGAGLVALSAVLIFAITAGGLLALILRSAQLSDPWEAPLEQVSQALVLTQEGDYAFDETVLTGDGPLWAMLLSPDGRVIWQWNKPPEVPETYHVTDVAAFTRWYLADYPVNTLVRPDGLLVLGGPKGSTWKYSLSFSMATMSLFPGWALGVFSLSLLCVLGLAAGLLSRWFRRDQRVRDAARSGWINGVSHDIRTPLSMVMGYAGQLEAAEDLPPRRRDQAAIIRRQSQTIRDLVNDLNLTMRLDCQMQALRKAHLDPAPFLRQTAADFLNSGLAEGYDLALDLPNHPLPPLRADPFLLRRALNNLLLNAVRHNAPGASISLGAEREGNFLRLWVENTLPGGPLPPPPRPEDGGAPHGTGLKLVAQIAQAHKGRARFTAGQTFLCQLWLPL